MILKFCGRYSSVFAKKKNDFVILQKKRSKIVCYRVKSYNWFSIFCCLFLHFFANKDTLVYFYNGVVIVHWEETRFESTIYQTIYLKFQHRWGTSGLNSAKWLLNCYFLRMLVMKQSSNWHHKFTRSRTKCEIVLIDWHEWCYQTHSIIIFGWVTWIWLSTSHFFVE